MKRWWEENGNRLAFQLEVAMLGKLLVSVMKYQQCCRVKGEFCSPVLMSQNDEALLINHVNASSYFTFEFYVGFFFPSLAFCTPQHFDPPVNPHTSLMTFQNNSLLVRFTFAEGLDFPWLETIGPFESILLPQVHSSSVSINYVV